MAAIGLRKPVFAPITTENIGAMPAYGAAVRDTKAVSASLTWAKNDSRFFADDTVAESDNGITSGTLTMGLNDLSDALQKAALGVFTPGSAEYVEDTDGVGTTGGFGFIRVHRLHGNTYYEAHWFYKVQFGQTDESTNTKGENIEWQPPQIVGTILSIRNDTSGLNKFRRRQRFETEEAAQAFIDAIIGGEAQAQTLSGATVKGAQTPTGGDDA